MRKPYGLGTQRRKCQLRGHIYHGRFITLQYNNSTKRKGISPTWRKKSSILCKMLCKCSDQLLESVWISGWKTVFQLEKKSWNTSLSRLTDFYQAEVGGKWGCWVWEGRGSASRWVLFSGPRHPTDERLICRAIYTNSALTSSNCLSAYAAPCLLINVSTGHQHRVTLGVFFNSIQGN